MEVSIKKQKSTIAVRKKKNLCLACGNANIGEEHICVENYILSDTRCYSVAEILRRITPPEELEIKMKEVFPPATLEEAKQKVINDNSKTKSSDKNFDAFYQFEFLTVDNRNNRMQSTFIDAVTKKYNNLPIYLLVNKEFKNSIVENFILGYKLYKVHIMYVETISEEEVNTILFKCKKIYTSEKDLIENCKKLKIDTVILPDNEYINYQLTIERNIVL